MNWMLNNWVERRAARERKLKNAIDVWKKAQNAIAEACDSLNQHFAEIARIQRTDRDRNLVIVTISRPPTSETNRDETGMTKVVRIQFEPDRPRIVVIEDHTKKQEFPIEADCDHVFVTLQGRELLLDDFSRLALEAAFFSFPRPTPAYKTLRIVARGLS